MKNISLPETRRRRLSALIATGLIMTVVVGFSAAQASSDQSSLNVDGLNVDGLNVDGSWKLHSLNTSTSPVPAIPRALATGDFDGDGRTDLVAIYESPEHHEIRIFPAANHSIAQPFAPGQSRRVLPRAVDLLIVGDFDADGHADLAAARRGGDTLTWLAGNGRGGFDKARLLPLGGALSALVGGEINRRDGLADVVAAIAGPTGPELLIFESPKGALSDPPEIVKLPAPAHHLALGRLNGDAHLDLALLADGELLWLEGRDRRLAHEASRRAAPGPPQPRPAGLPFKAVALAGGHFHMIDDTNAPLALLTTREVVFLRPISKLGETIWKEAGRQPSPWQSNQTTDNRAAMADNPITLLAASVQGAPGDGLVVLDHQRLQILATGHAKAVALNDRVAAVASLRLPGDALTDLVFIDGDTGDLHVAATKAKSTFVVNTADDANDGNCDVVHCSLREAILSANSSPGADAIHFQIGSGAQTIEPGQLLPVITEPVVIDGATQPGYVGTPLIELDGFRVPPSGTAGAGGLSISAGNSVIRGLVINRFFRYEILLDTLGGNIVEGNYLGTDAAAAVALDGTQYAVSIVDSPANLIGGSTAAARNVIAAATSVFINITGSLTLGTEVRGNHLGIDALGTTPLYTPIFAVHVQNAPATTLVDNVTTSGSVTFQIAGLGSAGALLQGNFMGVDAAGTTPFLLPHTGPAIGVLQTEQVLIGGTFPGAGNLISGLGTGIQLGLPGFSDTRDITVQGNFVGTDVTGTLALGIGTGIRLDDAADNLIGGAVPGAGNLVAGVDIHGIFIHEELSTGNTVQGNFVGTDITGTGNLGAGNVAVRVTRASGNLIGGTSPGARNLLCCHTLGVELGQASDNRVEGNFIGTDITGTLALPNSEGVSVQAGAFNNLIGGGVSGAGNLISGNTADGVTFSGTSMADNQIVGNLIGTRADGVGPLGNGFSGVALRGFSHDSAVLGNVIAFNGKSGVAVGTATPRHEIRGNSIHDNGTLGIDLSSPGVTPNDVGDGDRSGGNENQNFPVLTSATLDGASTTVSGTLSSKVDTTYVLELFANRQCDPSGYGEGETPLSTFSVTTEAAGGGAGIAAFEVSFSGSVAPGDLVTATATDPWGNTSEFSACIEVLAVAQFVVNSTADGGDANPGDGVCDDGAGACTLRAAIGQANAKAGLDRIHFDIPTGDPGFESSTGTFRIQPLSELPTITSPAILDGTTQPGFGTGPLVHGPLIVLDGLLAGVSAEGLVITAGGSTVRGLVIHRFDLDGIRLSTTGGNIIEGNFIGTDASGTQDLGNGRIGVLVRTPGNRVGGTLASAQNLISGNDNSGVTYDGVSTAGNLLQGNFIGTDITGTLALGNGDPAISNLDQNRAVHLNNQASGITIGGTAAGAGNVISGNAGHGIFINRGADNVIQANLIGTDATGGATLGNGLVGVVLIHGVRNTVGGAGPDARNVISANHRGVAVSGAQGVDNRIQGNYIGTDGTGTLAFGRQLTGINSDSPGTLIGGTATGEGNLISGNQGQAVLISHTTATGIRVVGNLVGTSADGVTALGNGSHGVLIQLSASGNTVGEPVPGGANTIAFNTGIGVAVTSGAADNTIRANRILANSGLGIDLAPFGVSGNDPLDSDSGANDLQNFPILQEASTSGASSTVRGFLESVPQADFTIELFASGSCDPSSHGEGESFVATASVTTDGLGLASFTILIPAGLTPGHFITATASRLNGATSEFSPCFAVTLAPKKPPAKQ